GYTGMTHANITDDQLSELYDTGEVRIEELEKLPVNHGFTLKSNSGSALGRMNSDKIIELVPGDQQVFGISGRSAEQRVAIDLLNDDAVGIVSIGGPAGTGKSALALCAGLEAVMERR